MNIKVFSFLALTITFLLSHTGVLFSQESETLNENVIIYLEEHIPQSLILNMNRLNLEIHVLDNEMKPISTLTENNYDEFIFSIPGNYFIQFQSEHNKISLEKECNHDLHNKLVEIQVLPYNLYFDFDQLSFSTEIVGGKEMSNETLSIPIIVKTYSDQELKIEKFKFSTAGVNTTLEGFLMDQNLTLKQGVNLLTYHLKGSASKNTYIMFDFYDMNGRAHSFGYANQIK